jgi:predicted nucleic acid-binding protein
MAVVKPVFFDTCVLLEGLIEMSGEAAPAQRIIDAIAGGQVRRPLTAWHCCLEFYAVSTRLPEDLRLAPEDALFLINKEILTRFEIHQLPSDFYPQFFKDVISSRCVGGRIYDAHIAEIAKIAGAKLVVTDNRKHFLSLLSQGIQVLTSREYAEALPS